MAPKYPSGKLPLHKGIAQGDSYEKASSSERIGGGEKPSLKSDKGKNVK